MDNNSESLDRQWLEIEAKMKKTAKDLINIEKKLNVLMSDIQFWEIVLELDGEAAK
jgi:PIN domain nuclease of toxin-antitoxin system